MMNPTIEERLAHWLMDHPILGIIICAILSPLIIVLMFLSLFYFLVISILDALS